MEEKEKEKKEERTPDRVLTFIKDDKGEQRVHIGEHVVTVYDKVGNSKQILNDENFKKDYKIIEKPVFNN